ncbi:MULTISPECIES: type III-A CRISPR-associated RAMP protein Csm5 [Thermodesulfobacterium]|jgi:CRISPR-associated protein Csm5|uniref:CRISPR system Cms protein Csm5 n=1 Tax=Thermodesulfobacterium commune TaxID=1741 RepID=A0A3B8N398_9BACT|nr:type III-A CRISPR-associated RAMP protein Csm5 [Thermodesulfobacterium sp.]HAA83649.1 type III-A CRISPR-associated RAMP protein Csm5 [Thermodesulfobacterium commune]MBZ4682400.1 csm5 [Thermodesulfobacterium sp.]MDK2861552.1 CRISPR-associated protein Csm5 [Thermodesulfobacterium sp.]MDN5380423.1 CRISPR-associated protein Csm5 [Thermodesulfobacterium sp.]HBT03749.1 type III-A CRISPR-associated RAMP protein Csm5 [Thermodesulfobacterium commune]
MKFKIIKIKVETLTPVHIGCDDFYEPTSFVIDPETNHLYYLSLWNLIENLQNDDWHELNKISEIKGPKALIELYKFYCYRILPKIKNFYIKKVLRIPSDLGKRYVELLKLNRDKDILQNFNRLAIPRTYYNPLTEEPIIPGSSLKGSIRTAYLEALYKQQLKNGKVKMEIEEVIKKIQNINLSTKRKEISQIAQELEKKLLNYKDVKEDCFKLLKCSDLRPERTVNTQILYQINLSKNIANQGGTQRAKLSIPVEVIPKGQVFYGEIKLEEPLNGNIKHNITLKDLLNSINTRYANLLHSELKILKQYGITFSFNSRQVQAIRENKGILLKIGKHSGAEAVTIEGLRKILIKGPGGRKLYKDSATTFWVASPSKEILNEALPFGWVMLYIEEVLDKQ